MIQFHRSKFGTLVECLFAQAFQIRRRAEFCQTAAEERELLYNFHRIGQVNMGKTAQSAERFCTNRHAARADAASHRGGQKQLVGRARGRDLRGAAQKGNPVTKRGVPGGTPFRYLLAVRLHEVQLSAGGMQVSFLPGKKASIGKSIWLNTSQGFSSAAPETFGQLLVGMQ